MTWQDNTLQGQRRPGNAIAGKARDGLAGHSWLLLSPARMKRPEALSASPGLLVLPAKVLSIHAQGLMQLILLPALLS